MPEEYDVFFKGRHSGYLRLRYGMFMVEFPEALGKLIYEARPQGKGQFTEEERDYYLHQARRAIWNEMLEDETFLSAHEKMELRLSMPREFWPKRWLDAGESTAK